MINLCKKDGGDLGRAYYFTTLLEFPGKVLSVANLLLDLKDVLSKHQVKDVIPSYSFEFSIGDKRLLVMEMLALDNKLPERISFYEIDNKRIFEMRGSGGGITTSLICYLIAN
jgi:hypothetical protein